MDKILAPFRQGELLNTLFFCNVFISFHYALIIYINSSFLSVYFSETQVSSLYIIGSIINTVMLLYASRILEKISSYKFTVYCIIAEFLSIVGMSVSEIPFLIGFYFLLHTVAISLILFNMDIFIERAEQNNLQTGSVRATYLTIMNSTIVLAPLLIAFVLKDSAYFYIYAISAVFIIPVYKLLGKFKYLEYKKIAHIKIRQTVSDYLKNADLYNIFISQFLLQLFYAFMIIYTPIYLNEHLGFSWNEIGFIFTIMLLPFVLFELPLGELSDYKYGEKEFLSIGFIIMGLSTLFISFVTTHTVWIWATILFITRIGASFVEISVESYFFKKVDKEKTDVISFFRISRPISFVIAPIIATIFFQFIDFQYIFILIGSLMIIGVHYSLALNDTL